MGNPYSIRYDDGNATNINFTEKCGDSVQRIFLHPECTTATFGEYGSTFDIILQIDAFFLKLVIQSFYICSKWIL